MAVARVGAQVADALAYAHAQGVLHRDIKPANLLLDLKGTVWVTDFGLAKAKESDNLTREGEIVGTVRYMAPERFDGAGDHRADIYALGLTLYEMLTLRPAFDAENQAQADRAGGAGEPAQTAEHQPGDSSRPGNGGAEGHGARPGPALSRRRRARGRPAAVRRGPPGARPPGDAERATVALVPAEPGHGHADHHGVSRHDRGSDDRLGARPARMRMPGKRARERDTARAAVLEGRQKLFEAFLAEAKANRMSHRSGQRFRTLERVAQAADLGRELNVPQERFDELRQIAVTALAMPDMVPRYLGEEPEHSSSDGHQ